jgi:hypothetical protein
MQGAAGFVFFRMALKIVHAAKIRAKKSPPMWAG